MFSFFSFLLRNFFVISHINSGNSFKQPLSEEEEKLYLQRYKNGDAEAKNVLIERNLRLVAHIAKKYSSTNYEMDDLISIGIIGLIKAISSFDMDKNTKLGTYAARCIHKPTLSSWLFWRKKRKELLLFQRNGGYSISQARICI